MYKNVQDSYECQGNVLRNYFGIGGHFIGQLVVEFDY